MTRTFLVELRRSLLIKIVPILCVAHVSLMWIDRTWWEGVWPAACAAVGAPLLFLGPIIGAICSWETLSRNYLSPIPQMRELTTILFSRALIAVLPVFAGLCLAMVACVHAGAPLTGIWWSYIVVAIAVSIESAGIGLLLGSFGGPRWFAPTTTALLLFLRLLITQGAGVDSPESAYTRIFLSGDPFVSLNPIAVWIAVVEALLICALFPFVVIVTKYIQLRREGRRLYPATSLSKFIIVAYSVIALVCASTILTSPPMTRDRSPVQPVCIGDQVRICFWPEQSTRLTTVTPLVNRAEQMLDQWGISESITLNEYGVKQIGLGDFVMGGRENWFLADAISSRLTDEIFNSDCQPDPKTAPEKADQYSLAVSEVRALIQLRLVNGDRPADSGDTTGVNWDDIEHVYAMTPPEQQEWIKKQIHTAASLSTGQCS